MSIYPQSRNSILEIKNYNDDFLILKSENKLELTHIGKTIFQKEFGFIDEVVVTEFEICLKLNKNFNKSKIELLQKLRDEKKESQKQTDYKLPIYFFNHKDWQEIILKISLSKKEIIEKLLIANFSIAMFGFLPGFIYLRGLDKSLHIPRKAIPSKYIEANSIAVGGKYLGLYSISSPGGWHVIGKTPISILTISHLPPISINLGDTVKLHSIDKIKYEKLLQASISLKEYSDQF